MEELKPECFPLFAFLQIITDVDVCLTAGPQASGLGKLQEQCPWNTRPQILNYIFNMNFQSEFSNKMMEFKLKAHRT